MGCHDNARTPVPVYVAPVCLGRVALADPTHRCSLYHTKVTPPPQGGDAAVDALLRRDLTGRVCKGIPILRVAI
jgi:hypothetical protein